MLGSVTYWIWGRLPAALCRTFRMHRWHCHLTINMINCQNCHLTGNNVCMTYGWVQVSIAGHELIGAGFPWLNLQTLSSRNSVNKRPLTRNLAWLSFISICSDTSDVQCNTLVCLLNMLMSGLAIQPSTDKPLPIGCIILKGYSTDLYFALTLLFLSYWQILLF